MTKTANYNLNQWDATDPIDRRDFNSDNAAIDAALGELSTNMAQAMAALGTGGHNCRIAWGSYVGTGTYGESNPTGLTFEFTPLAVWVYNPDSAHAAARMVAGGTAAQFNNFNNCTVTWSGKSVSWYCGKSYDNGSYQNNAANTTYRYVAIGY